MQKAIAFFLAHAGTSYNPATETREQGKQRGAEALARAEMLARDAGYSFQWEIDPDVTSADWIEDRRDGGRYRDPWHTWQCTMRDDEGKIVGSLGGIDFGRDGEPWGDTYRRVVEAELSMEHATEKQEG